MTDICLICLDEAKEKDALYLLHCGCKVGWFHLECENNWIDMSREPLKCPACRRQPSIHCTYAFHYSVGPDQSFLWITAGMVGAHTLFFASISYLYIGYAICLPFQTLILLLPPFMFRTSWDMNYYLFHIRLQILLTTLTTLYGLYFWSTRQMIYPDFVFFYNFFHIVSFIHVFFVNALSWFDSCSPTRTKVNPFEPYVISYEITHCQIQYALPSTEAVASAEERDEALTITAPVGAVRRSQRLLGNH